MDDREEICLQCYHKKYFHGVEGCQCYMVAESVVDKLMFGELPRKCNCPLQSNG